MRYPYLLSLLIMSAIGAAAQPGPTAVPAWQSFLEAGGADPFAWRIVDERARVRLPADWLVTSDRERDQVRLLALPPGEQLDNPLVSYLLILRALPVGTPAAQVEALCERLLTHLGEQLAARPGTAMRREGSIQSAVLDGQPLREQRLVGLAGEVELEGAIRIRYGDHSIALSLAFWPQAHAAAYRRLVDHVDASLAVRIEAWGWRAWLPLSWAGEPGPFQDGPAITFAHRRLRFTPDADATRLIVRPAPAGAPQALVETVARRLAGTPPTLRRVAAERYGIAERAGHRVILTGMLEGRERTVWVMGFPALVGNGLELWLALGAPDQLLSDAPRIEALLASREALPVGPREPQR
jgi:hypothetical protein